MDVSKNRQSAGQVCGVRCSFALLRRAKNLNRCQAVRLDWIRIVLTPGRCLALLIAGFDKDMDVVVKASLNHERFSAAGAVGWTHTIPRSVERLAPEIQDASWHPDLKEHPPSQMSAARDSFEHTASGRYHERCSGRSRPILICSARGMVLLLEYQRQRKRATLGAASLQARSLVLNSIYAD